MYDVEVNVDTDTCTKCVSPYPGPDGKLSVKCQHGCTNGRVMEGDQCCSVCKQAPHGLAATRGQTLECLMETKGEFTCAQLYSKNRMQVSKELRRFIEFDTKKEKFDMGNVRAADYDLYKDAAAASKETLRALLVTKKILVLDKKRDRNGEESTTVLNARRAE